jgi:hypothetical protein
MDQWYIIIGVLLAALFGGAALGAFWVEGLKRTKYRPLARRKKRDPDPWDEAMYKAWTQGAVLAALSGLAGGLALWDALASVVLTISASIGGLGSRIFYDKVLDPVIRAFGEKAAKRIAGHTVAPRPETRVGMPAVDEDLPPEDP